MATILSIETSAEACSAALAVDGEIRERFELAPRGHAERILPMIQGLLADAELTLQRIDAIAFGRGPGSFTSLRIGIGVVQGLAWGADLPVVPVSSLAALAAGVPADTSAGVSAIRVALDARMQEVYTATYSRSADGKLNRQGAERVCPPGDIGAGVPGAWIAAGNGFERYPELAEMSCSARRCLPDAWPRAAAVCALAEEWLGENEPLPAALAQPVYLRNKVAKKPAN
jgi:tRNA threonylcarbamoyladenosine biosynthesis protein TsaB